MGKEEGGAGGKKKALRCPGRGRGFPGYGSHLLTALPAGPGGESEFGREAKAPQKGENM